ncbi:MAG: MBOAT family O-acyltransferase [Myxococcota bacterium]
MVFDSVDFLIFFAVVFALYHLAQASSRLQNALLLATSLFFYGYWDPRFVPLLLFSASVDFVAAQRIAANPGGGRRWLAVSVGVNLGVLGFFKYFDFFSASTARLLGGLGMEMDPLLLDLVLPVGISFYTLQSMAYTIDVHRGVARVERDPVTFFAYIAFFPQLVAGPIERAQHLLVQFRNPRVLTRERVVEGVWDVIWGLFLKIGIANSASRVVSVVFVEARTDAAWVALGTLAFGVQIYCDFNGYSTIARGSAALLGFDLRWNFERPYLAASVRDFWRRWHISLSTWLRDYLYIPLGGSRRGPARTAFNLMVTMLLGGLWHGAAWNFVFWGALHGAALGIHRVLGGRVPLPRALSWFLTMGVVFAGWAVFRASEPGVLSALAGSLDRVQWSGAHTRLALDLGVLSLPVLLHDLWAERERAMMPITRSPLWVYVSISSLLMVITWTLFGRFDVEFIYFQF